MEQSGNAGGYCLPHRCPLLPWLGDLVHPQRVQAWEPAGPHRARQITKEQPCPSPLEDLHCAPLCRMCHRIGPTERTRGAGPATKTSRPLGANLVLHRGGPQPTHEAFARLLLTLPITTHFFLGSPHSQALSLASHSLQAPRKEPLPS